MVSFEDRVVAVLRRLRRGEVVSYGEVAAEAGSPGAARAVGTLLRRGLDDVPWWRVVRADGALVCPHGVEQATRLAAEGITVVDGRVRPWASAERQNARGVAARARKLPPERARAASTANMTRQPSPRLRDAPAPRSGR